jgi:hypothetical protein
MLIVSPNSLPSRITCLRRLWTGSPLLLCWNKEQVAINMNTICSNFQRADDYEQKDR